MADVTTTSGTDVTIRLTWKDGDGNPLDLTGYTPDLLNVSPALTGALSIVLTDAVNGVVTVSIEGTAQISVGSHNFRARVTDGSGDSLASPLISLRVV